MTPAALRADIPLLENSDIHYLDNAATALMPRQVITAMAEHDSRLRANVGRGVHSWAEQATAAYEGARTAVAQALGTTSKQVAFCSGATAALNMLATSTCSTLEAGDAVWLAVDNHHSNIVPWQIATQARGIALHWLPANADGSPKLECVATACGAKKQRPKVIAVTHASNVTGTVTDISKLAESVAGLGARLVVDGAQGVPHELPDLERLGADLYVFSGHKCYAPNGIGIIWGRDSVLDELPPSSGGGGSVTMVDSDTFTCRPAPHKWEAGTPPISQSVALAAATGWMRQWDHQGVRETTRLLASNLCSGLADIAGVNLLCAASGVPIVSFTAKHAHAHDICQLLAQDNVAARGGHHCAQPLMRHWGIDGCTRLSIAPYNSTADISKAVAAVAHALDILA